MKGESSTGKSYVVKQVLRLFPTEAVKNFTRITPQSLYYMNEDELRHKVLVIFERSGSDGGDYSIRSLISENVLQLAVTIRDPETGDFVKRERVVHGPVSFVETTTDLRVHPENETRLFSIFTDESDEQTRAIYAVQDRRYLGGGKSHEAGVAEIMRLHHAIQRTLEPVPVRIPVVHLITFPLSPPRLRRDHERFLALLEVSAVLHQDRRARVTEGGGVYIEATADDYAIAYELARDMLADALAAVHRKSFELLRVIREIVREKKTNLVTRAEIEARIGWNSMRISRYIQPLVDEDFVAVATGGQGKRCVYRLTEKKGDEIDVLRGIPTPDELRRKIAESRK